MSKAIGMNGCLVTSGSLLACQGSRSQKKKKAQAESTRERDGSAGRQTKKSETGETEPKFTDSLDPYSFNPSQDPDEDDSGDEGPVVPFATNTVRTGSRIAPAQPGTSSQHFGGKRSRKRP